MPNRRQMVLPTPGVAATCAVCQGVFRAAETPEGLALCPACRTEAQRLAAHGDPRAEA